MTTATYIGVVRQGNIQLHEPIDLPDGSQVCVIVPTLLEEQVARRKANRWLVEHVGNMVMADQAILTRVADQVVWRFGAFVTGQSHPPRGPIGHVDVDALSGEAVTRVDQALTAPRGSPDPR